MAGMNEELMADVIEGSVRLAWSGATTDAALVIEELRSGAESLGGTVTVDRCPVGMDPAALSSRLSADAREIGEGVRRIFDPGGVLL
jgi:hypothetical protein